MPWTTTGKIFLLKTTAGKICLRQLLVKQRIDSVHKPALTQVDTGYMVEKTYHIAPY